MTTMIERISRAIEQAMDEFGTGKIEYEWVAKRVLAEIRIPTEEMVRAAGAANAAEMREIAAMWQSMIDNAALTGR